MSSSKVPPSHEWTEVTRDVSFSSVPPVPLWRRTYSRGRPLSSACGPSARHRTRTRRGPTVPPTKVRGVGRGQTDTSRSDDGDHSATRVDSSRSSLRSRFSFVAPPLSPSLPSFLLSRSGLDGGGYPSRRRVAVHYYSSEPGTSGPTTLPLSRLPEGPSMCLQESLSLCAAERG